MEIKRDKAQHFWVGFMVSGVFAVLAIALKLPNVYLYAIIPAVVIGIGKEMYDLISKKGTPKVADALATVAGSLPITLLALLFRQ